jgi:hypothetical protein
MDNIFDLNFIFYFRLIFIWAVVLIIFWLILRIIWRQWKISARKKYREKQNYILLSVNVPRDNEQGPEAIERFFAHLAGIKISPSWWQKNIKGVEQLDVSLEIISQNGQISFLIYTPVEYRDLVEASLYSIYPGVEIFESEDYTQLAPLEFPDEKYDLWGADLGLYNKNPYPIRTYPSFEHSLSKELKDPMTGFLEILGKLHPEEQVWIQFIIEPSGSELKKQGEELIKKITGEKTGESKSFLNKLIYFPIKFLETIVDIIVLGLGFLIPSVSEGETKAEKTISFGDKKLAEAIQNKISKIAFATKIRLIYLAEKDVFSKERGITGIISSFNTVNTLDLNGLSPEKKVFSSAKHPYKTAGSKEAILEAYRRRACYWETKPKGLKRIIKKTADFLTINIKKYQKKNILNIEELATLYHFPVMGSGRAPLIKKTGSKKGEPPFFLPVK